MGDIISLPFAALLRWMYGLTGSYGLSIILFAVIVKLVILPFQMKSKRGMVRMGRLSGKQAELQKQYANNQQKYQEELSKLYQEEGVNPMGGCLWSLLPMFIIFPLYSIIYRPITHFMRLGDAGLEKVREIALTLGYDASKYPSNYEQIGLTDFVSKNWEKFSEASQGIEELNGLLNVNFSFLGLDLSTQPQAAFSSFNWGWACIGVLLIPVLATSLQYLSSVIMAKSNGQSAEQRKQMRTMNLLMPLMSLYFCFIMPAAMGVYWIVNTILATVQEFLLGKFYTKKLNREEDEREAARAAARAARMEEAKLRAAEQQEHGERKAKKPQPKRDESRESTTEAGRVDDRPYARGRSYQADRYNDKE